jgi:glutathione S-transferase
MLQLYGNPRSRATRCLWMLEEMGVPYQLIEKSTQAEDLQTADYLRLNRTRASRLSWMAAW